MTEQELSSVALIDVDEMVLEQLVQAATTDAAADDVTPPLTDGPDWTEARIEWLQNFHRNRRAGLSGPAGEATWALLASRGIVGSVRLKRTDKGVEAGIWLTRTARGQGLGTAAMTALQQRAAELGAREIHADTTASNVSAVHVLQRLGFDLTYNDDSGGVQARLRLHAAAPDAEPLS